MISSNTWVTNQPYTATLINYANDQEHMKFNCKSEDLPKKYQNQRRRRQYKQQLKPQEP